MKIDDPEENAFELDSLVAKPKVASRRTSHRAAPRRPKQELFARITRRHCTVLAKADCASTVIFFQYLMMCSIKVYNHPIDLRDPRVKDLIEETGMNRRRQMRAVRNLAKIGIIRTEGCGRGRYSSALLISIPQTTKKTSKTT
jgi:hypothetical protein